MLMAVPLWSHSALPASENVCPQAVTVERAAGNTNPQVTFSTTAAKSRVMGKEFFGFNTELVGFQDDLWDSTLRAAKPAVLAWLRPFDGAVYRYPGGGISNFFDWSASVGPIASRPAQALADWKKPVVANFGFDEFLQFVSSVKGRPWVVVNLQGRRNEERPVIEMAKEAGEWARYASQRAEQGSPRVLRWELGNELDRGQFQWPSAKYVHAARTVALEMKGQGSPAEFVALMEDYDAHKSQRATDYNSTVARELEGVTREFALHPYFDGRPGGPPVGQRLQHLCNSIAVAERGKAAGTSSFWVTEFARWPPGRPQDPEWKKGWWRTVDLEAAIAVADAMIGASQIPQVKGMFLHSLGLGVGPWPLFHRENPSGQLHPSAVYYGLRVLRDAFEPEVLATHTQSDHKSGYEGGYDVRGVVLASTDRRRFTLWAINRDRTEKEARLVLASLSGRKVIADHRFISNQDVDAENGKNPETIRILERKLNLNFDKDGAAAFILPPHSVSALQMRLE
jgi:alpha-L-arabinofuranosidase